MLNREEELRFCKARRAAIALDYQNLNPEQRRAALATEGPLLLLAGAGSGKTTVLIHRIANLMKYGRGSDCDEAPAWAAPADLAFLEGYVQNPDPAQKAEQERLCRVDPAVPWSIIAITFTNKAAGELKERLERMLGPSANDIWASTFHSACVRILRRDIDRLGFTSSFTIYDTADSERVIKDIVKDFNLDEKAFAPRSILGYISRAKDAMKLGKDYLQECEKAGDYRLVKIAKVYAEYERRLREANALDFDDIILDTVRLLQNFDDVREYYQKKFRYVLIDEYQDTNNLQYLLASTLAGGYENICVVGDDDQSIYRFRGATIENILSFESQYKGARVIRLEQNYRSTKNILEASNAVIRNNEGRKGKELWTEHEAGDKVHCYTAMNEHDEAQFVAAQILAGFSAGRGWREHAVLYRMNAQSNQLEQAFKRNGIPYRIIGGIRFFDRAEVKDMMAYLCAVNNPNDDLRLSRIINNPPRGIGATTVERAQAIAQAEGRSLWDVVSHARDWPELQKAAPRLSQFAELMAELRKLSGEMELPDFYEELVQRTGYAVMLEQKNTVEDRTRLENVHEVLSSIQNYLENAVDEPSLAGFLDEIALYTDLDSHDPSEDCVVMMTMHSAKGLEFPVVFVVGVEEGIFPGIRAIGEAEEWAGRGMGLEVEPRDLKCNKRREYERKEFMDKIVRQTGLTVSKLTPATAAVASVTQRIREHSSRVSALEKTLNSACGVTTQKRRRILTQGRQLMLSTLQQHPELAENVRVQFPEFDHDRCTMCGACVEACPTFACDLLNGGKLAIEPTYCIGCGLCAEVCSDHALKMVERDGSELVVPDPEAERKAKLAAEAKAEYAEAKAEVKQKLGRALDQIEKLAD